MNNSERIQKEWEDFISEVNEKKEPVTFELLFPFEGLTETIEKVTFRPFKMKERLWAQRQKGDEIDKQIALMSRISGLVPEDFEEMDSRDFNRCETVTNAFLSSKRLK